MDIKTIAAFVDELEKIAVSQGWIIEKVYSAAKKRYGKAALEDGNFARVDNELTNWANKHKTPEGGFKTKARAAAYGAGVTAPRIERLRREEAKKSRQGPKSRVHKPSPKPPPSAAPSAAKKGLSSGKKALLGLAGAGVLAAGAYGAKKYRDRKKNQKR